MPQQLDLGQYIWPDAGQRRQPQFGGLRIDWSNEFTVGLDLAYINGVEIVSGSPSGFSRGVISPGGQTEAGTGTYPGASRDKADCTIIAHHYYTSDNGDYGGVVWGFYNNGSDNSQLGVGMGNFGGSSIYAVNRCSGGSQTVLEACPFPYEAVWAITTTLGSTPATVYKNGVLFGSAGSVTQSGGAAFGADSRRTLQKMTGPATGKYSSWVYKFSRILSAREIAALSADPWQIILTPTLGFYGPAANADNLLGQACL